jgi:uncharacterized protein (DUF4415 family)
MKTHILMIKRNKVIAGRGYTEADWQEVSDNPRFTDKELKHARAFAEVLPQFASAVKGRGKQKKPTKELISLRLNRDTIASFRALGDGWQTKIDEVLEQAAKELLK